MPGRMIHRAWLVATLLLGCGSSGASGGSAGSSAATTGGASGASGALGMSGNAGALGASGASGASGAPASAGAASLGGSGGALQPGPKGSCSAPETRVTEIDVGAPLTQNEDEAALKPLAISAIPAGGSRVAWLGADKLIHVTTLQADDTVDTAAPAVSVAGNDYGDVYADNEGGVLMVSRDAQGGGTLKVSA